MLVAQPGSDSLAAAQLIQAGKEHFDNKRYGEALEYFRQGQARYEALGLWANALTTLGEICDFFVRTNRFAELEKEALRARELIRTHLDSTATTWPNFLVFQSMAVLELGRIAEAVALDRQILAWRQQYTPTDTVAIASAYGNLGRSNSSLGDLQQASEALQAGRALLGQAQSKRARVMLCRVTINAATVCGKLHQLDQAQALFEEALAIAEAYKLSDEIAVCLYNAAAVRGERGDVEGALYRVEKSKALLLETSGPEAPMVGYIYNLTGILYGSIGQYAEAREAHNRSLAIARKHFGEVHPQVAASLTALGQLAAEEDNPAETVTTLRASLAILDQIFPGPHPLKTIPYILLAETYLTIHPDSAQVFAQNSYDNALAIYGPRNANTADGLAVLAQAAQRRRQTEQALALAQRAVIAASQHFEQTDPAQNPAAEDFALGTDGLKALAVKASILQDREQAESRNTNWPLIAACLERGEALLQRSAAQLGDVGASDFAAQSLRNRFIKNAINLAAVRYADAPGPASLAYCYRWLELDKAQRLRQAVQNTEAKAFAGLPDSLLQQDAASAGNIAALEQSLKTAEESGDSVAMLQLRSGALFEAKRDREALVRRIEREYPEYFALKYQNTPLALEELQRRLPPGTLVLEINFDPARNTLYLLPVTNTTASLVSRVVPPGLDQNISRLHALLQSPATARAPRRAEFVQLSHELYRQFIAPIESQLTGIKHLVICGEGAAQYLPFEVLLRDGTDQSIQALDFLIRRFEVSYHYSATLLAQKPAGEPRTAGGDPPSLLGFAPVFPPAATSGPLLTANRDTSLRAYDAGGQWSPLPYSEKEVQDIARLFQAQKPGSARTLLREQATEPALLEALSRGHRIVHIASHSFANIRQPKFSGIACFSPDPATADGTMYVGEIYNLAARADLVVLSSCESGLGRLVRGEGLLGLNRAFLYAGVPNVMYSLWKVNDRAAADFMVFFYRAVLEGKPYAAALRSAKLKMLENPATAAPGLWSGFLGMYHLKD